MYTDLATTLLPLAMTLGLVSDILLIDFGSRPISSFRKVQVNKLNLRENSEHHIVKHGNDGLYCSQSLTIVPMNTIAAKKPKHPANDAVEAWGNTAPTMVAQNQFCICTHHMFACMDDELESHLPNTHKDKEETYRECT